MAQETLRESGSIVMMFACTGSRKKVLPAEFFPGTERSALIRRRSGKASESSDRGARWEDPASGALRRPTGEEQGTGMLQSSSGSVLHSMTCS